MTTYIWLAGTSGVGKSTVGWQLQRVLDRLGVSAAFVDADQLRNTAGVDSPEELFVAGGIAAVEAGFSRAGTTMIVVAGMVDDELHLSRLLPQVDRSDVFVIYLTATDDTISDRVVKRRWNVELLPDSIEYARRFDTAWVDMVVDTSSYAPDRIAVDLASQVAKLARSSRSPANVEERVVADPPALTVLTGAGGVGLSTTGFLAFLQRAWAGHAVGYLDSHQLGFLGSDPRAPESAALRAANTVSVAAFMGKAGVESVVIAADPSTARALADLSDAAQMFWLDASDATIESRHRARAEGGGPPLAGDHRIGLDEPGIRAAVASAITEARDESLRPSGATIISTDGLAADRVAEAINSIAIAVPD